MTFQLPHRDIVKRWMGATREPIDTIYTVVGCFEVKREKMVHFGSGVLVDSINIIDEDFCV